MTLPPPTYDLMLLLDPQAEDATRAKIVADAVKAIEAQGELVRRDDWGERPLAYPIDRKASADYHLLQFHVGQTALLEGLDRTLRITDGVLRHRIIKLNPGTPDPPEMTAAPPRGEAGEPEGGQPPAAAQAAPAQEPPADSEPAPAQEPPADSEPAATAQEPPADSEPAAPAQEPTADSEPAAESA
jgi:small subunit ribosomal protein S6